MTAVRTLRIGTRASALARTQTDLVAHALGAPVDIVPITTEGDRSREALTQIGGTGVFVSALREALLAGDIDVAVHSYKDLPTARGPRHRHRGRPGSRGSARRAHRTRRAHARRVARRRPVGTGSPRRAAQLRALGLGLDVVAIRGNVDTRLGKVAAGEVDAVVLAYAGLRRLGRGGEATEVLDPIQVLPAPAQGALAIECRTSDDEALALLAGLDHADTRSAVTAERALLTALEAGCSAPVGALAEIAEGENGTEVFLRGSVTAVDGSDAVRLSATGPTTRAEEVGRRLAGDLLADGADQLMGTAATSADGPDGESST